MHFVVYGRSADLRLHLLDDALGNRDAPQERRDLRAAVRKDVRERDEHRKAPHHEERHCGGLPPHGARDTDGREEHGGEYEEREQRDEAADHGEYDARREDIGGVDV